MAKEQKPYAESLGVYVPGQLPTWERPRLNLPQLPPCPRWELLGTRFPQNSIPGESLESVFNFPSDFDEQMGLEFAG